MPFPAAGLRQIVSRETFVPTIALLRKADKPRQNTAGAASRQRQPMHPPALRMAKKHRIRKKSRALTVSDAKPLGRARSRTGVMHRGGFLLPLRSARAIPNSMPFCHSLPYRLLNQDRHAPPRAASPVGRLAIGRDGLLADGRRGLPSRRRAFAGRADPGYVNSGLTAEGRWADRNGPQKGTHAARCAGSGMSDAVGCRIGEAKGSG